MDKSYLRKFKYLSVITIITVFGTGIASSGDLDDGIPLDDALNDDLKPTLNIPFILMKAKGDELRAKKGIKSSRPVITTGDGGQGNITFGVGTKIAPGTTIINAPKIKDSNTITTR
jgi:hypothetical protein